jgi:nifR3 family TIM-barrel protein
MILKNQTVRPILDNRVNFPVCLAPMVGLTHVAFRLALRRYLPEGAFTIWPTEMLSSRRLPNEQMNQSLETKRADSETGLVPQILGNEENQIARSVKKLEDWGAEGIDINMGCPVAKALRHNYGVSLMGDVNYAREIVAMTVRNTGLPVAVKLRAGIQNDPKFLIEFVQGLENAGASWLCLHPRLAAQKRRGYADWSQIKLIRDNLRIPVIGNGDVQTTEDVNQMLNETSCDMVMIGRALTARPWLLWQVGRQLGFSDPEAMRGRLLPQNPEDEGAEFGRHLLFLLEQFRIYIPEPLGVRKFMFYLTNSHPWLEFGHSLHANCSRAATYNELYASIEIFFKTPQSMSARTDLRY